MKKNNSSQSGLFNPRAFAAFTLCFVAALLAIVSFAAPPPRPAPPSFGHPIISGIGGVGFEQGLRVDPSNPNRLYTSVPGSLSSDTSWIWHSLDGGKTFKWVVGATALEGKVTTCFGGGDTETGVDSAGHLYFADLTLANFSTSRSDDHGATFTCSNTGVPCQFAVLPTPVKHVFVIHDDALLNRILIGRCFPVAFGPPVPNVSDPSGLNCVDLPVANLGSSNKTGANFPTMAIDKGGNLYAVWEQAPINDSGQVIGDTVLKYSFSTDQGNTWAAPIQIDTSGSPVGTLHNNVFAWTVAGDDGRVDIAWYGTPGVAPNPSNGPDSCNSCDWSLWMVQTLNGHASTPTFTAPILAR